MASTAGIAPATSTFARWRSDLTELRGHLVSVAGLAPARLCLKGRLRELLCIHGQKWPLESESHRHLLGFSQACRLTTPSSGWSSRAVTLRGLPVISRVLCF